MSTTQTAGETAKGEFQKQLRADWQRAKELSEKPEYKQKYQLLCEQNPNGAISLYSFSFVLESMQKQGLDGLPYLDCKTFNEWKNNGFIVKKGEKCKIKGIVWKKFDKKEKGTEEKSEFLFPKVYNLFHSTQVRAI